MVLGNKLPTRLVTITTELPAARVLLGEVKLLKAVVVLVPNLNQLVVAPPPGLTLPSKVAEMARIFEASNVTTVGLATVVVKLLIPP